MRINDAMILLFWVSCAVILIAGIKLVGCHYTVGLYADGCGWWAYLAFLLADFAIVGSFPFALLDLLGWDSQSDDH